MRLRNFLFITMLALCPLLLRGQSLTNAAPLTGQEAGNAVAPSADSPAPQSGSGLAASLPNDPGQEILPVAQPEPAPASGVPVVWEARNQRRAGNIWTLTGDVVVHSGFFFEERQIGQVDPKTLTHTMALRKRVDVTVTDVRAGCSRTNLLPLPGTGSMVMDLRVPGVDPPGSRITRPPSYINPTPGQWPTLEEAAKLAETRRDADAEMLQRPPDRGRASAPPPDIR